VKSNANFASITPKGCMNGLAPVRVIWGSIAFSTALYALEVTAVNLAFVGQSLDGGRRVAAAPHPLLFTRPWMFGFIPLCSQCSATYKKAWTYSH
jgi:hypothetical protein